MLAVEVSHIVKSFSDKVAVDDLSFSVAQGEMFGLIGHACEMIEETSVGMVIHSAVVPFFPEPKGKVVVR